MALFVSPLMVSFQGNFVSHFSCCEKESVCAMKAKNSQLSKPVQYTLVWCDTISWGPGFWGMLEDLIWMFAKCHGINHLLFSDFRLPTWPWKEPYMQNLCQLGGACFSTLLREHVSLKCTVLAVKATLLTFQAGQQVWIRTGPDQWRHVNAGIPIACRHLEDTQGTFLM